MDFIKQIDEVKLDCSRANKEYPRVVWLNLPTRGLIKNTREKVDGRKNSNARGLIKITPELVHQTHTARGLIKITPELVHQTHTAWGLIKITPELVHQTHTARGLIKITPESICSTNISRTGWNSPLNSFTQDKPESIMLIPFGFGG